MVGDTRNETVGSDAAPITLADVRDRLGAVLPDLRARYRIDSLGVFGSVARGEARPDSDVDVLVSFATAPTLLRLVELEQLLSDRVGAKVDLVVRRTLKPHVRRRVDAELVEL